MSTPSPSPSLITAPQAARQLSAAITVADDMIADPDASDLQLDAAWVVRLLILGALTDPRTSAPSGRDRVRRHVRDLAYSDAYGRAQVMVYRQALHALNTTT